MSNPGLSTIRDAIVNYNNFFNPYICHVCKISENLQVCHWCRLISYCCKEHLQLHREQHKEFCLAVISLSDKVYYSYNMTLKEWTEFKKANVKRVKNKLGRDLESYEEQILLFAKSCLICRRQHDLSVVCKSCMSVSMCSTHKSSAYVHNCKDLQLCTRLDIDSAVTNEQNVPIPAKLLTYKYLKTYFLHRLGRTSDFDTWHNVNFLYTNYLSRPMTLLSNMTRAGIDELTSSAIFTIHVIAGSFTDQNSLMAWELLLHEMVPECSLIIDMIETKIGNGYYDVPVCQTCHTQKKEIFIDYFPMTYIQYTYTKEYSEPDIFMGFDIDFEDDKKAIRAALMYEHIPLVLTCKSESRAQQIVTEVKTTLSKEPVINEKNKFASCRPYRDDESDSVFFQHQYVIIYNEEAYEMKNLDTSSNHNQPSTSTSSNLFQE
ncbi:uncharacterized protein LOC116846884 isoform X1 [Odontomachus brunneus]|uniref:uncharacterized protein LOC116846884 isoform X1 n=1 Tax=Odontomachus brunneus TaxID=486640 RepID=UPI0013F1B6A9|nr:uncharacterized protein LOC116846884 isoform X1 [Odontomachus brunneus]